MRRYVANYWCFGILILTAFLASCKSDVDYFIGTWSIDYKGNGADIALVVVKDGDGLLVKEMLESKGIMLGSYLATVDGNHLNIPMSTDYKILVLSEDKQSLAVVNNGVVPPDFHRRQ